MGFNFNEITADNELAAKAKFREYGVGVSMTKFANAEGAKWEDLIDAKLYSMTVIKDKMLEIARRINTTCNDELLGDLSVAFTKIDEREKRITFTWLEIYIFLRAAYRYRLETAEYKAKKAKASELRAFINANKSVEDKLAEASKELAALDAEL
jgi:hypothetical protein